MPGEASPTALLLGAGFSKWASDLPLASELFDFGFEPFGPRDRRKLAMARGAKGIWEARHPGEPAEAFVGWALLQPVEVREAVLWYIVHRLSRPWIWEEVHAGRRRRHVLNMDDGRKWQVPGTVVARDFLEPWLPDLTGVVTTNYDLLVEYALGTLGFHHGVDGERLAGRGAYPISQWRKPAVLRGKTALAKVHGSISWSMNGRHPDGRAAIHGDALIVPPVHEKQPSSALRDQWALAGRILDDARRLVVFGFAFNPYDEAFLGHLRHHGRSIEAVVVIDCASRRDRVAGIWPEAQIEEWNPPTSGVMKTL